MAGERVLSQEEIDDVFKSGKPGQEKIKSAQQYDFRRPDRIPKDQLRSIHLLHENFARSISSSLSAYLRAYVAANLVSVEQLSFVEFTQCLPTPSCLVSVSMKPFDGNALLELNPSLVFPTLDMLLGGRGTTQMNVTREVTEIEQSILESVFRIILNDLKTSWQSVAMIDFRIDSIETEPQLLQVLAPNEAVVSVSMELRIGESTGMMNLAIPSITVKMLRQKFDQQWSMRRAEPTDDDRRRILDLINPGRIQLDAQLRGPKLSVEDLLELEEGQLLVFDYPVQREVQLLMNGRPKFRARMAASGQKRSAMLGLPYDDSDFIRVRGEKN